MTHSPWQRPLAPHEADVVVIGGGVVGCATALAVREESPGARVVIVERGPLASGASGRNAGFVLLGAPGADPAAEDPAERERALRLWRFTEANAALVVALDGRAFGLEWTGSAVAAGDAREAQRLRRHAAMLEGVEWLGPEALHARIGAIGFHGGIVVETGGALDPVRLVRHLAALSGATVVEHTAATGLEPAGGAVRVRTARGPIHAGAAAVCTNAYLSQLLPDLARWVRPVRAQMLATGPLAPACPLPVYSHEGYFYLRQRPDGSVLVGGARHLHRETETGYEDATTPTLQRDLLAYLARHAPALTTPGGDPPEAVRRWSGTMGFSPDGLPVASGVPGVPGAHVACGFSGQGMSYALRFGRLMARRALGREDPDADLFAAERFGG